MEGTSEVYPVQPPAEIRVSSEICPIIHIQLGLEKPPRTAQYLLAISSDSRDPDLFLTGKTVKKFFLKSSLTFSFFQLLPIISNHPMMQPLVPSSKTLWKPHLLHVEQASASPPEANPSIPDCPGGPLLSLLQF